jgi:hypothetical protein
MTAIYQENNGLEKSIDQSRVYTTSDSSFWTAMRSKEIYPFRVSLTENCIQVSYEMDKVAGLIPEVINGSTPIDELDAHGGIVLWKALIGLMKMLSRYDVDLKFDRTAPGEQEKIHAYTTDQYLVWVLSFRGITPTRVASRGRDTSFEFGPEKIEQLKDFLFRPYMGNMQNFSSMKNIWRQAKTFRNTTP